MAMLDDIFGGNAGANPLDQIRNGLLGDLLKRAKLGETQGMGTQDVLARMPPPVAQNWQTETEPAVPPLAPLRNVADAPGMNAPAPQSASPAAGATLMASGSPATAAGGAGAKPFETSMRDRIVSFGRALQGADPGDMTKANEVKNQTYDFLVRRGVAADDAKAIIGNPALFSAVLPRLAGTKQEWKLESVDDGYGQKRNVWVNPLTREVQPFTVGGGQPGASAPTAPAMPMAPAPSPVVPVSAPLGSTVAASGPAAPMATAAAPAAPAEAVPEGFVVGGGVPKPPEGFIQRPAPGGAGFLWTKDGKPVFDPKVEVEARARVGEKRADTQNDIAMKRERAAEGIRGGLERLMQVPVLFGQDATERAIGPWSGADQNESSAGYIGGALNTVGGTVARARGALNAKYQGGADPTEVRNRIQGDVQALASTIKPLIRQPGEGAWSDKDQALLNKVVGNLATASTVDEYVRAVEGVKERIESNFGFKIPDLRKEKWAELPANAPKAASEVTTGIESAVANLPGVVRAPVETLLGAAVGWRPNAPQEQPAAPAAAPQPEAQPPRTEQAARFLKMLEERRAAQPAPQAAPTAPQGTPPRDEAIRQAQQAIAAGRDPNAVRARLKQWGYDLP